MTLPTSNISLLDIQNEFGGASPISLSEYYAGGGLVSNPHPPSSYGTIPTGGEISTSPFRGVTKFSNVNLILPSGAYGVAGRYWGYDYFVSNTGRVNSYQITFYYGASGGAPAQGVGTYTYSVQYTGGTGYNVSISQSGVLSVSPDLNSTGYYRVYVTDGITTAYSDLHFNLWW